MRPEHRTTIEVVGERFERRPSEEVGKVRKDSGKLREEFAAEMGTPRLDVHDPRANLRMGSDTCRWPAEGSISVCLGADEQRGQLKSDAQACQASQCGPCSRAMMHNARFPVRCS